MDTTNSGPTPPDGNRAESLSVTTQENSDESALPLRMNRRDFMDMLGRTTLVGAAFSVSLIGAGCGAAGLAGTIRDFAGVYDAVAHGVHDGQDVGMVLQAVGDAILNASVSHSNIAGNLDAAVSRANPTQLTGTYNPRNGEFDIRGQAPDGTDIHISGNLPDRSVPTRASQLRVEYGAETLTGSIVRRQV